MSAVKCRLLITAIDVYLTIKYSSEISEAKIFENPKHDINDQALIKK